MQQSAQEAQLAYSNDDNKQRELEGLYGLLYGRERDAEAKAERDRAFAAAQAEVQAATRRASGGSGGASGYGLGGYVGGAQAAPKANMAQRAGGGFNFTDAGGKPISAAKYAQMTGQSINNVLAQMAKSGDGYAANAYNWLRSIQGTDFANNPQKLYKAANKNFSALFWGV
jgi:hypothetical protein